MKKLFFAYSVAAVRITNRQRGTATAVTTEVATRVGRLTVDVGTPLSEVWERAAEAANVTYPASEGWQGHVVSVMNLLTRDTIGKGGRRVGADR